MTFDSEQALRDAFASEAGAKTIADMPNYKAGLGGVGRQRGAVARPSCAADPFAS